MLQFILGPAGSGKTYTARSMLVEAAKAGKEVLLIVPEQYSFETEKAVLETGLPGKWANPKGSVWTIPDGIF